MSNTIKIKRGTNLSNAGTPAAGELIYKSDTNQLFVGDGSTAATGLSPIGGSASGDIEGVTAGNGLTGGGTSGTVDLNIGAGTGIDVAADAISVDVSDFMANGANNRVLTATGTDAFRGEGNLTFDGSTLAVTGAITASSSMTVSGSLIADTLDVAGDITLDADGADVILKDGGTEYGRLTQLIGGLTLKSGSSAANAVIFSTDGDAIFAEDVSISAGKTFTFDGVGLTAVQTASESFADNNTSLMTSAAINDRIESFGYITSDTTLSTEQVQDIVGAMFSSNTETRISATYQDGDGTIDLVVDDMTADTNTQLSTEQVQDIVGGMFSSNTETRVAATYDDTNGKINVVVDDMTANDNTNQLTTFQVKDGDGTEVQISQGKEWKFRETGGVNINWTDTDNGTDADPYDLSFNVSTSVIAGTGLSGGGQLNADRTININFKDEDDMSSNSASHAATQQSIKAYVDAEVAGIVDSAPEALNTLNELAEALGDDDNFNNNVSSALGNRLRIDTASQGLNGTQQANAITNLGITATKAELNFVDGVTSAIQTQLNAKLSTSGTAANSTLLNNLGAGSFLRSDTGDTAAGNISFTGKLLGNQGTTAILNGATVTNVNTGFTNDISTGKNSGLQPFRYSNSTSNTPLGGSGSMQNNANWGLSLYSHATGGSGNYGLQMSGGDSDDQLFFIRRVSNGSFGSWFEMWHSGNDGADSGLDADLLDGNHASAFLTSVPNHSGNLITSGTVAAARIANLAASKITSGTLGTARIPNLDAAKIVSGTFAAARIAHNSFFLGATSAETGRTVKETGLYHYEVNNASLGTGTETGYYEVLTWGEGTGGSVQLAGQWFSGTAPNMYFRTLRDVSDDWTTWQRLLTTSDEGSGNGLDADTLDGLQLNSSTRNNQANTVVRTQSNGYALFGWINTTSGNTTNASTDYYVNTNDGYIRKKTLANVRTEIMGVSSGSSFLRSDANDTASGVITFSNRVTSTGTDGFTIGNYSGYDRIVNNSNVFRFLTDGNAYANMQFATVTAGTWNGTAIANAYVADLPASKITSGELATARVNWDSTDKTVRWDNGRGYHGNPRSMSIGYSGGNYGQFGYNIEFTTTSGQHTYSFNDIATRCDLFDGLQVYTSDTGGSAGSTISWTELLDCRGDVFQYKNTNIALLSNGSNNRLVTSNNATNLNGEGNLTFNGHLLTVSGNNANGINMDADGSNTSNSERIFFTGTSTSAIFQSGSALSFRSGATAGASSGTERMYIDTSGIQVTGNVSASADVIAFSSSDKRLKDNLKPIENSLDKVSKLSGYEFDWNDKQETYQGHDVGVVAQEVEEVLPEVVQTRDNGYKAVKYEKLVPLLIESIKELKAEIEELKK